MAEIAINEYRGVRMVCGADVTEDESGYVGGKWKRLFGAQSIEVNPNESSETHYYDNRPAIQIDTEGAIGVPMTVSIPELKTKAWIEGKTLTAKGQYVGTPKKNSYKALAFIGEKDDGTEELNIFYKGKFTGGGTKHDTKDDGTSANNTTYDFGSIYTNNNIAKDEDGKDVPCNRTIVPLDDVWTEKAILGTFTNGESDKEVMTPVEIEALKTA
ncbi:MAG: major tail protein [Candidatus Coproplasma sp.]